MSKGGKFEHLIEIGNGFYNLRGSFPVMWGMVDMGTQMSFLRLDTGKFLVVDTCKMHAGAKAEVDELTDHGRLIEAVIGVHPFHTEAFSSFHKMYPHAKYYGTPRHLRKLLDVPWTDDLSKVSVQQLWLTKGVEIRVPEGSDFVAPSKVNHFPSAIVYHRASRTLHVDDTIMLYNDPPKVMGLMGIHDGKMDFHPTMTTVGLEKTPQAPLAFQQSMEKILRDWDFDNICCAHNSIKIGGAKEMLAQLVDSNRGKFAELSKKRE